MLHCCLYNMPLAILFVFVVDKSSALGCGHATTQPLVYLFLFVGFCMVVVF